MLRLPVQRRTALVATVVLVALGAAALVVADTVTQPLDVHLQSRIEIFEKDETGQWQAVDEVGPVNRRFEATLLELASGHEIGSDFAFQATTKKGREYSARLARPAKIDYNPATGRFDADLVFEIGLDGQTARVPARLTTESRGGAGRTLRGARAQGVLGRGQTTMTLVSANEMRLPGGESLLLLCEERYRLIPKGAPPRRS